MIDFHDIFKGKFEEFTPFTDRVRKAILELFLVRGERLAHDGKKYDDRALASSLIKLKISAEMDAVDEENWLDMNSIFCSGMMVQDDEVRFQLTDVVYQMAELCNALIEADAEKVEQDAEQNP